MCVWAFPSSQTHILENVRQCDCTVFSVLSIYEGFRPLSDRRGNIYAFHSHAAVSKIWHFHPKPARWWFQAPDVVNWPQAELQDTHALVEMALNMAERCYWHPSDSLVFSAVVWGEIWTSFQSLRKRWTLKTTGTTWTQLY